MTRIVSIAVALMMMGVLTLGCNGCDERAMDEPQEGDIVVVLRADRGQLEPGQDVVFQLELHNLAQTPVRLTFASEMEYDVVVSIEKTPVWSWSFDYEFEFVKTQRVMDAGQILTYDLTWPGTAQEGHEVEPGVYEARAMLLATNVTVEEAFMELTVVE